jgi:PAB-dependent poly(A)-specific ribonuclease subunit 2
LYLVFNCAELFKRDQPFDDRYLCESFGYIVEKAKVVPMRDPLESPPAGAEIFDIVAVVSRVTDFDRRARLLSTKRKKAAKETPAGPVAKLVAKSPEEESEELDGHLVTHVKVQSNGGYVPPTERFGRGMHPGEWLLFNDIRVTVSDASEALDFTSRFRAPAVLIFKKRVDPSLLPHAPPRFRVNPEVFLTPSIASASKKRNAHQAAHVALPNVKPGDLVAIDCEFVALTNDVYEVKPDGSRVVTAPRQLALARLSCMTADGRILMDDYVATGPEPIADYLTRFSGLVPGDLDPSTSLRHILPHRIVYSKLLYLLDAGCVFVGHGLSSDFKVVNIVVPPEQMRDTVELFWIKGMRMFSLRFLSSVLLGEDIQDRVHDSIQDASAALKLYQKYLELEESKKLDETLKRLYMEFSTRSMS